MAREAELIGAPPLPALDIERAHRETGRRRPLNGSFVLTTSSRSSCWRSSCRRCCARSRLSLKSADQITTIGAPIWPADPGTFEYEGETLDVYLVPLPDGTDAGARAPRSGPPGERVRRSGRPGCRRHHLGRLVARPRAALGVRAAMGQLRRGLDPIDFPRLMFNTIALAVIGSIGTIVSCTLVAYGFARFRFPGRNFLFLLLLSTIFLPAAVTLIPTYTIFVKLGWVGTWLPLLVPAFFANAYDVFLLRQYFLTLPRELDDAAKIDGAGPLRILMSVIVPQSWAVIVAVAIFHLVYSWNLYFEPLLYLSTTPDLQPIALGLASSTTSTAQSRSTSRRRR